MNASVLKWSKHKKVKKHVTQTHTMQKKHNLAHTEGHSVANVFFFRWGNINMALENQFYARTPHTHLQKPPRTKNAPPEACSFVPQLFLLLHVFCVPVGLFSNVSFLPLSLQQEDTGTAIIIFQRVTTDNVIRKASKNKATESHCTLQSCWSVALCPQEP